MNSLIQEPTPKEGSGDEASLPCCALLRSDLKSSRSFFGSKIARATKWTCAPRLPRILSVLAWKVFSTASKSYEAAKQKSLPKSFDGWQVHVAWEPNWLCCSS
jgi:hypothetical protein